MKVEKIKELIEIANQAKEVKVLVELVAEETKPYVEQFADFAVDIQVRMIKRYEDAGFSREEAISMTRSMKNDINNINRGKQ